jgi:hypothetical protein
MPFSGSPEDADSTKYCDQIPLHVSDLYFHSGSLIGWFRQWHILEDPDWCLEAIDVIICNMVVSIGSKRIYDDDDARELCTTTIKEFVMAGNVLRGPFRPFRIFRGPDTRAFGWFSIENATQTPFEPVLVKQKPFTHFVNEWDHKPKQDQYNTSA